MDQEPDVIRQHIDQTRSSLTEKLECLEGHVRGTVEGAKATVENTIQSVKDTVQTVKQTFDLKYQTEQHPWPMVGGAVFAGFVAGRLTAPRRQHGGPRRFASPMGAAAAPAAAGAAEAAYRPNGAARDGRPGMWLQLLGEFDQEINQLKSMAIGAAAAALRDYAKQYVPQSMAPQFDDLMNNVASKLGGTPVRGPLTEHQFGSR